MQLKQRLGLPVDTTEYDRRVVVRARYITTDPATGKLIEFEAVKVGARRSLAADARNDHTGSTLHRIHC
jgi:hypothetical protein